MPYIETKDRNQMMMCSLGSFVDQESISSESQTEGGWRNCAHVSGVQFPSGNKFAWVRKNDAGNGLKSIDVISNKTFVK